MADRPLRALVALLAAGALAALGLIAVRQATSSTPGHECALSVVERPPYPARVEEPLTLKAESASGVDIPFGRTRSMTSEMFFLTPQNGLLKDREIPLNVRKRPLRRQELYGTIAPRQYEAVALVTGAAEVTLRVCVPSSVAMDVHPGTYTGGIVIADRRVEKTTVALSVSLQYPSFWWFTILFAGVVLVFGSASAWAAGRRARAGDVFAAGWRKDLWGWTKGNLIAIALGIIAGTSAWLVSYWRNPSWGAKAPEDWFTLLGAMFAAFTAALTAASRAGESPTKVDQRAEARAKNREVQADGT